MNDRKYRKKRRKKKDLIRENWTRKKIQQEVNNGKVKSEIKEMEKKRKEKEKNEMKNKPCLMTMPGGTWTIGRAAFEGLTGMVAGVPGGGDALALPTEPGSLNPWVLFSSGPSKKLRLNSLPASNDTSGVRVSGAGALPRPALSDWSILKTSIVRRGNGDDDGDRAPRWGHHSRTRLSTWFDSRPARMSDHFPSFTDAPSPPSSIFFFPFLSYFFLFLRNKISRREEYRSNPSLLPLNLELDFKS